MYCEDISFLLLTPAMVVSTFSTTLPLALGVMLV